jgi:predicted SnoaL-like aldol condensation-catalyzing enzyme
MSSEDNKAVISGFLLEVFNQRNLATVDEVFAPDHALLSPETGTEKVVGRIEVIKRALKEYHAEGPRARCTILNQIAEGDWIATSYTLGEEQAEHMGIMISHLDDGKIKETFVVAREVSSAPEEEWEDRKIIN